MSARQQSKLILSILRPADNGEQEFLVFELDHEEYAIDLQNVQELRKYEPVMKIANAPSYVKGVINLRNTIVPIVDLRVMFGLRAHFYDQFSVVIIVNLGEHYIGIVVDGVSDVVVPKSEEILLSPRLNYIYSAKQFKGSIVINGRSIFMIDIMRLINQNERDFIEKMTDSIA